MVMAKQADGRMAAARDPNLSVKDQVALLQEAIEILRRCQTKLDAPELEVLYGRAQGIEEEVSSSLMEAHAALIELAENIGNQPITSP